MNLFHSHSHAKSWRALLVLFLSTSICASALSGCATKARTYRAPDAARMTAARTKLGGDVDRASASAKIVRKHVGAAQVSAGKVAKFSGTTTVKLRKLYARVTPELRPAVEDIQTDVAAEKDEESILNSMLNLAVGAETVLDRELDQAQNDKANLSKESATYAQNAEGLAQNATDENAARRKAEAKLHWYRMHWWGTWIVFGLGILACIAFAVLKFMGKLTFL